MSRAPQKPRFVPASVGAGIAGLVAVLAVAGCGAGQNSQTDSVEPAVNGNMGQVGPIMIRNAVFAFPRDGVYPAGGEASLVLTIVNSGATDDELTEVTSTVAGEVEVSGDRSLPARRALQIGTPDGETGGASSSAPPPSSASSSPSSSVTITTSTPAPPVSGAPSSSAPSQPVEIGLATIVLKGLTAPLQLGKTYPVTFVFRNAGSITLELPIAAPTTARPEPTGESHG